MAIFKSEEMYEAHRALLSTLQKCEKIDITKLDKAQQTLLLRRISALKIALILIEDELSQTKVEDQTVSKIAIRMIEYSKGNLHDIDHFMRVYAYAKTIGELEGLDRKTQIILEVAALIHDIACPLCREKYGNTNGKNQEKEGELLAAELLENSGCPEEIIHRVIFLVGHHHTLKNIEGLDYQILVEADYIANAGENNHDKEKISNAMNAFFKTAASIAILKSTFGIE